MKTLLNSIYMYVFGNRDESDLSKLSTEIREARTLAIQKKKRQDFQFILQNAALSQRFHTMLDKNGCTELADILFPNKTTNNDSSSSSSSRYEWSQLSKEQVEEELEKLYQEYGLLDGDEEQTINDFYQFYLACKLRLEFIELDGYEENRDQEALRAAYNLLVLFGKYNETNPFKNFEDFIKLHLNDSTRPLHDILINELPEISSNNIDTFDLITWQKTIKKGGMKTLAIFSRADELHQLFGKAPETPKEAADFTSKAVYKRYEEYPELAELCQKYGVKEENFNKCLELEKEKKTHDTLPDCVINGEYLGHPGYFLVKLPKDDPRKYILGKITACCQSIGDNAENCVIDGVKNADNGFYVLLKGSKEAKPLNADGKINYAEFELIGQGYTWRSKAGNFIIDSWENLRSTDNPITHTLLQEMGKQITKKDGISCRVCIGLGGKTPDQFKTEVASEAILNGTQYGDSYRQALVYLNPLKLNKIEALINVGIENLPLAKKKEFKAFCMFENDEVIFNSRILFLLNRLSKKSRVSLLNFMKSEMQEENITNEIFLHLYMQVRKEIFKEIISIFPYKLDASSDIDLKGFYDFIFKEPIILLSCRKETLTSLVKSKEDLFWLIENVLDHERLCQCLYMLEDNIKQLILTEKDENDLVDKLSFIQAIYVSDEWSEQNNFELTAEKYLIQRALGKDELYIKDTLESSWNPISYLWSFVRSMPTELIKTISDEIHMSGILLELLKNPRLSVDLTRFLADETHHTKFKEFFQHVLLKSTTTFNQLQSINPEFSRRICDMQTMLSMMDLDLFKKEFLTGNTDKQAVSQLFSMFTDEWFKKNIPSTELSDFINIFRERNDDLFELAGLNIIKLINSAESLLIVLRELHDDKEKINLLKLLFNSKSIVLTNQDFANIASQVEPAHYLELVCCLTHCVSINFSDKKDIFDNELFTFVDEKDKHALNAAVMQLNSIDSFQLHNEPIDNNDLIELFERYVDYSITTKSSSKSVTELSIGSVNTPKIALMRDFIKYLEKTPNQPLDSYVSYLKNKLKEEHIRLNPQKKLHAIITYLESFEIPTNLDIRTPTLQQSHTAVIKPSY